MAQMQRKPPVLKIIVLKKSLRSISTSQLDFVKSKTSLQMLVGYLPKWLIVTAKTCQSVALGRRRSAFACSDSSTLNCARETDPDLKTPFRDSVLCFSKFLRVICNQCRNQPYTSAGSAAGVTLKIHTHTNNL